MKTKSGAVRRRESYTCWCCATKYQATFDDLAHAVAGSAPCPLCWTRGRGNYLKDTADLLSGIPIVVALSCAVLAALAEFDVLGITWAASLAALVCLVFAVETWRRAAADPDRSLAANRQEAERLLHDGQLLLQIEGNTNRTAPPAAVAGGWKQVFLVMPLVGAGICLLPIGDWLALSLALIIGPLLAIASFAALAYFTSLLQGEESLTGSEILEAE